MLDFNHQLVRIPDVSREDKALLRSNLSARLTPEDGQEHIFADMLLPSCSSFGPKATNLLSWCSAPTKVKTYQKYRTGATYVSIIYPCANCRNLVKSAEKGARESAG
jgi:hypothetical protein